VFRFASVLRYDAGMGSLAYADEAIRIRRLAPLTERDIARATGAGVSTVSAWLHRTRAPRGQRAERLVELSAIIERLAAVLEQDYVPVWMNRPLSALGHRKPIDVLAGGGYEELSRIVTGLESPTFS
jgi:transcriptional regulator with XRE-family HTH domain